MTQDVEQDIREARRRIEEIRERIAEMDLVSSGTLLTRKKTCGKKSCRCSVDVEARHGPYNEWNRRKGGRLVHMTISDEQAKQAARAIASYREVQRLLTLWEHETVRIITAARRRKA
jgi:hypothetical protein